MTELSPDAEKLLRDGRAAFSPSPERLRAVREALAVTLATDAQLALAERGAVAGKATTLLGGTVAKIGLATLVAISAATAYFSTRGGEGAPWQPPAERAHGTDASSEASPSARSEAPSSQRGSPAPVGDVAERALPDPAAIRAESRRAPVRKRETRLAQPRASADPGDRDRPEAEVPQPAPAPPRVQPSADLLAREAALLRTARAAVTRGDNELAIRILSSHEEQFPDGVLREERYAIRARALCAVGRFSAGRAEIRRLAEVAPRSPHLHPIERACAGVPEAP